MSLALEASRYTSLAVSLSIRASAAIFASGQGELVNPVAVVLLPGNLICWTTAWEAGVDHVATRQVRGIINLGAALSTAVLLLHRGM